ncbi:Hypothetical predicted protein [Lecanosticta acicola]|uniref:CAP-Gly domain-containing protein n=1 Tax=Lecanosticta acicola TaxID=111012 RepID=A0AAI8Z2E9_9PEZI|nr:Hypothetical predicted protein [Lecanosticta acicola]
MEASSYHIGQRLSLKGQLCTIRYIGAVADKPGDWLGVEWDDPTRGKHDGTHDGVRYFECRNTSKSAASFLKSKQTWDRPRSFYQALREKYMPEHADTASEIVYFSSKRAEEVGFEKFAKRQAQLQGIHTIVLDYMQVHGEIFESERSAISETCGHVTELDLGSNLFESLDEIMALCALLPKLSRLTLDGNRFTVDSCQQDALSGVRSLSLSNTWLTWPEICTVATHFPNLTELLAAQNGLKRVGPDPMPKNLKRMVLSGNEFGTLNDLESLAQCERLEELLLKHCHVSMARTGERPLSETIRSIDLSHNRIVSWTFFNVLEEAYPNLKQLHVGGNPLYKDLKSAEGRALTAEDGYMLTIARLPRVEYLNYSKTTEKERLNAEVYYLSQVAAHLTNTPAEKASDVLREHPRWKELCDEYGEPTVANLRKEDQLDPGSLAARLVRIYFVLAAESLPDLSARTWTEEIPKSFNIYSVLGLVGKRLGIVPFELRLIWETGEEDPVGKAADYAGPEWWDSSDDECGPTSKLGEFVTRDVELVASTRAIGTYFEGREARVRVEANP